MSNRKAPSRFRPEAAYSYKVEWSDEDKVFIGSVAEFGFLSAHGDTPEAALKEIMFVVGEAIKSLREQDRPVPEPLSARTFSGRFNVRIAPDLHKRLSVQASREGVSLNTLVADKLSS